MTDNGTDTNIGRESRQESALADPTFDKIEKISDTRSVYKLLRRHDNPQFIRSPDEEADVEPDEIDVVVHMGCHSIATPHIIDATMDVVESLGYNAVAIGGFNNCCGMMDLKSGDVNRGRQVDANRFDNISHFSPTYAVMECTACHAKTATLSLRERSPEFEVISMVSFLNNHRDQLIENISVSDSVTIALHDHYDERGWMPDSEADNARELFSALPGVDIVEMQHSRGDRLPCTFLADSRKYPYDDLNTQIFNECVNAGADVLVGFWHACNRSLAPTERDFPVTLRNYATFVGERLGFSYQDIFKKYVHMGLAGEEERILAEAKPIYEANGVTEQQARQIISTHFTPE